MTADAPRRTPPTVEGLLELLDRVFEPAADRWTTRDGSCWWDGFYAGRDRDVPFFRDVPDESLVAWHADGLLPLPPGARVLDLGCGPGRNAVWLAQQGCRVDAVDLSPAALRWAGERAAAAGVRVDLLQASIFDEAVLARPPYDLVYDSGCFHHLPPHRRLSYVALLDRLVAPGGHAGLCCFAVGGMGAEEPDEQLYRTGSLGGGLAYGEDDLRAVFAGLDEVELRRMRDLPADGPVLGLPFLWVGLFRRPA